MTTASGRRTQVRAACPHDCPDTCAMLVTVDDGRAVAVRGDPEHPFTRYEWLCVAAITTNNASTARIACSTRSSAPDRANQPIWAR